MISEIYNYYFKKLGNKNLLFRYTRKKLIYMTMLISFIILVIGLYLSWTNKFRIIHIIGSTLSILISFLIIIDGFNREYKKVLKLKYQIDSSGLLWNSRDFNQYKNKRFKEFLKYKGLLDNSQKFQCLIDLINEQISNSKAPYLVNKGIWAAILLPTWTQYISWLYKDQISTSIDAFSLLSFIFFILIIFEYFFRFIKSLIYDEFINGYYNNLKVLNNKLKEVYLETL